MDIDRRAFLATLSGVAAIEAMSPDALADALEHHMIERLDQAASARSGEQTERPYRRDMWRTLASPDQPR
jgi:hypothetical protein